MGTVLRSEMLTPQDCISTEAGEHEGEGRRVVVEDYAVPVLPKAPNVEEFQFVHEGVTHRGSHIQGMDLKKKIGPT